MSRPSPLLRIVVVLVACVNIFIAAKVSVADPQSAQPFQKCTKDDYSQCPDCKQTQNNGVTYYVYIGPSNCPQCEPGNEGDTCHEYHPGQDACFESYSPSSVAVYHGNDSNCTTQIATWNFTVIFDCWNGSCDD